ncbi:hypothetical protein LAZ67_3000325, partial [Cordylochernes scorpioides]
MWPLVLALLSCLAVESRRIVDLSHAYDNRTLNGPVYRQFKLTHQENFNGTYWKGDEIYMATHTGTHLDAPCHFSRGRWCVTDIPLERLVDVPAVVIDVNRGLDGELIPDDLVKWEAKHGSIPKHAVILLRSGWHKKYPNYREYYGTDMKSLDHLRFPGFSIGAARWLLNHTKIAGLGVDGPSVDPGRFMTTFPVHVLSARSNLYLLESLADISELPASGARLTVLPMKIVGGSGAPVRVIAHLPSASFAVGPSSILLLITMLKKKRKSSFRQQGRSLCQHGPDISGIRPSFLAVNMWPLVLALLSCLAVESRRIVDLSHAYDNRTLTGPVYRPFKLTHQENSNGTYWKGDEIYMATHTGTHLDAPCHFSRGRWCVTDIPLERLVDVPAVVIDVNRGMDGELIPEDLVKWEAKHGSIPKHAVILLRSGWHKKYPNPREYYGTDIKSLDHLRFPGFSIGAARWLLNHTKIAGLGVDGPSVDPGRFMTTFPVHVLSARSNLYLLESLADISELPASGARLTVLPMKIVGGSGAPVRVIAHLPSASFAVGPSSILLLITML